MSHREIPKINFLQIHYFLTVVEKGSFTHAAKQLYTSQSSLSKMIQGMEESLGIILFVRNHKRLLLTEAGEHLYERWKYLLKEFEQSIEESRILQGGYANILTIGVLDSHNPEHFALPAIRRFIQSNPDISLSVRSCPVHEIRQQILSGRIDLAYTVLYDVEQLYSDDLEYIEINTCPHNVCMLSSNPLADKEYLEVAELEDSLFVSISPLETPSYYGMVVDLCQSAGFRPNFIRYTNSASSLPYNLISDKDIFICDRNYKGYIQSSQIELQFRPIIHTKSGIAACWRKGYFNPALKRFISYITAPGSQ